MRDRSIEAAGCEGKYAFASRGLAERVQNRRRGHIRATRGQAAYKCRFCHSWHIGTKSPQRQRHEMARYVKHYEDRRC